MLSRLIRKGACALRGLLAASFVGVALVGCGGDGAGAGGGGFVQDSGSTQADAITVLKSVPTLSSADGSTMEVTAIVKNKGNVGLAEQPVTFSTTDRGVRLEVLQGKTDAAGAAAAKLTLNDVTNRDIVVNVRSGQVSVDETIRVVGTTVAVSGPASVALGQKAEFAITVRDSAGNPIGSKAVSATSKAGNPIEGLGSTNSQGQLRLSVVGNVAGQDVLTVSALGDSRTAAFTVSGDQLSFVASPVEPLVNTAAPLTIKLVRNNVPQVGTTVGLTATRGQLSSTTAVTDANGVAAFSLTSATAGETEVRASTTDGLSTTARFEFVSNTPVKLALQASPSVVGANLIGTSSNASQLIAVVRDAADNPVKNQRVNFSFISDPSNGRIDPGSAVTDSTGTATVAFIAGPTPTGNNKVEVRATVDGTAIVSQTTLTVARRELYVRIGTGNEIEKIDATKNAVPYTAIVSDSSGNPVKDVTVQASIVPLQYLKGFYTWGGSAWVKSKNLVCANEDLNGNGQLDPGEDDPAGGVGNGDGVLTPGNPAVITFVAGSKTNDNGTVDMKITYPRDQSTWLVVRLRVTAAVVAGTEGVAETAIVLPGLAADYINETVAPPGAVSPYGRANSDQCTVPD